LVDRPGSTEVGDHPIADADAAGEKSSRDTSRGEVIARMSEARVLTVRHDLCSRAAASEVVVLISWERFLPPTSDYSMVMQVVMRPARFWACTDQRTSTLMASSSV